MAPNTFQKILECVACCVIYMRPMGEEQLRKASKSAVCKINIDSDSRLAFTAAVRTVFNEKPGEFAPRKYGGPARDLMEQMYKHKSTDVLGSDNKLAK